VTTLVWDYSSWEGVLIRYFQGNYVDLPSTLTGSQAIVGAYETYDIQGSYRGFKNLRLSLVFRIRSHVNAGVAVPCE
jgi:hypothetical protein